MNLSHKCIPICKKAATLILVFVLYMTSSGMCIDISNDPMDTKVQAAPPNIMFVLDNSGSMDWEFMTQENDGKFSAGSTEYEYLFDDPGDNNYSTADSNGTILTNSARGYWKSQWSGYNKIFYNPHSTYKPWPDMGDAKIDYPWSNPVHNSSGDPHIDLAGQYYSFTSSGDLVIVDNDDSGFSKSSAGWNLYNSGNFYGSNYYYTNADSDGTKWAKWTPNLTDAGNYDVYVWWRDSSSRVTNISYKIVHNGTTDTKCCYDQTSNGGQWHLLGTYYFAATGAEYVQLDASVAGTSKYSADAIKFVKSGTSGTVNIKNAHYYILNDANSNNAYDSGEDIYLVTWEDSNSDGVLDNRLYYKISGAGDTVSSGTVVQVNYSDLPDSVKPASFKADGSFDHYKTDAEDLQNFANWYSYYRRRELAAKAAVASSIVDLNWVNVGFYTINSGVRQTVLPINVETNAIIIDNKDSGYQETGSWHESSVSNEYENSSRYTKTTGGQAKWTPYIPSAQQYKVYAWWDYYSSRDTNALYTVHYNGGTDTIRVNQRDPATSNQWILLGTYSFAKGTSGYVTVTRDSSSTGSSTSADAVKFEPVSGGVNEDDTDTLLTLLYSIDSNGGTPLRTALLNVGRYFDQDDGNNGNLGDSPYLAADKGGACQQAFTIVMTDGYWNGTSPGVGNTDGSQGEPYADSYSNTLADVAMKFYNDDLADSLDDNIPTNNYDKKKTQHMVTYTISFGVTGSINQLDINGDGVTDDPSYTDDPYFLNPATLHPVWPNPTSGSSEKIDDLWHAAVNGRGQFFSADNPQALVNSLKQVFENLQSRIASGASVSVNGDELNTGTIVYQSTYTSGNWTGDVVAYPVNPITGEILKEETHVKWHARDKLQEADWNTGRRIITSNGMGTGLVFSYSNLTTGQKAALENNSSAVDYIRGKEVSGFRSREKKLGDIVHSAPLLVVKDGKDNDGDSLVDEPGEVSGTIFAGGNDGMLHAFNAETGVERFAYIPHLVFDHLMNLTDIDYQHRFYVDATPYAKALYFAAGDMSHDGIDNDNDGTIDEADEDYSDGIDNDKDGTVDEAGEYKTKVILVGGLGKGGRGYYALDVTDVESIGSSTSESDLTDMAIWEYPSLSDNNFVYAGDQTGDGIDNDGDSSVDEADENYSDGVDNDGDGSIDEAGEKKFDYDDSDMGYSFSKAFIVKSYITSNPSSETDQPWVVIFGNGYNSANGHAVLYILNALTGDLIRKIDTDAGGDNGLSSPAIVDIDNDGRADYVYAGDLKGNLWKFDITNSDSSKWGVAFGTDGDSNGRIDGADAGDVPQPLFSSPNQPITSAPDVMFHCEGTGYLVLFGTGKFLGETDRSNTDKQTIYGVWDFGSSHSDYLGTWNETTGTLSNLAATTKESLLEQLVINEQYVGDYYLRTLSNNHADWSLCHNKKDDDNDTATDEADECGSHMGWYFDLPLAGERVIEDVMIRNGNLVAITFIPNDSPCSGGGMSIVHEMNACDGSRLSTAQFDINEDGKIDANDMITITVGGVPVKVAPTGKGFDGQLHPPVILTMPDKKREIKILSSSAGTTETLFEKAEELGIFYWRERN